MFNVIGTKNISMLCYSGKPSTLYDDSHPDWSPTLRMGHNRSTLTSVVSAGRRYIRHTKRGIKHLQEEADPEFLPPESHPKNPPTHFADHDYAMKFAGKHLMMILAVT